MATKKNLAAGFKPLFDGLENLNKAALALQELAEADNMPNAARRFKKIEAERAKYLTQLQELFAMLGVSHIGNAKQKIEAMLIKTATAPIAAKYDIDCSFLEGVSKSWEYQGVGKTEAEIITSTKKKIEHQRQLVTEAYNFCLRHVEKVAQEAGYTFEQTREVLQAWSDEMEDEFHRKNVDEFYNEYNWKLQGVEIKKANKDRYILLVEALPLVQDFTPKRIYNELIVYGPELGTVRSETFEKWESQKIEAEKQTAVRQKELLDTLKVKIIGLASHRIAADQSSLPNANQENILQLILTAPEYNPHGDEFCVNDETSLTELTTLYDNLVKVK